MASEGSRPERAASIASSHTATADESEKLAKLDQTGEAIDAIRKPEEDLEMGDEREDVTLLAQQQKPEPAGVSTRTAIMWMVINTLATIGIVGLPWTTTQPLPLRPLC